MSQPILLPFPGVLPKQSADLAGRDRPFFSRIDALRGLGAVAVAAYHLSGCGIHGRTFLPLEVDSWNDVGSFEYGFGKAISFSIPAHASLMFFFVVSGFVLRLALEHGPTSTVHSLGRFTIARIFRFFPIVIAGTIVLAILSRIHLAPEPITSAFSWVDFFTHAFLLDTSGVGVLWALQAELLMVPIFFVLWRIERIRGPKFVFILAIITSALSFKPSWALWRPLSQNLFAFVLGTTVPTLGQSFVHRLSVRNAWILCSITIALLFSTFPVLGLFNRFSGLIEGYAAWLLVSFVAYRRDLSAFSFLDHPWLVQFGKWSGSYYVLHILTVPAWLWLFENLVPTSWSAASPLLVGLTGLSLWLLLMIGVAAIGYAVVEEPGIRVGAKIIQACGWTRKKPIPQIDPLPLRRAA